MRRPTLCSQVHTAESDVSPDQDQPYVSANKEGRLSRVRRMITNSFLLGRRSTSTSLGLRLGGVGARLGEATCFGTPLEEETLTKEGVPFVVVKICSYLENYGLHNEKLFELSPTATAVNPGVADKLRRCKDLDLESEMKQATEPTDVQTIALLLQLWLKDLPQPLVDEYVLSELLAIQAREKGLKEWRQRVSRLLGTLPDNNLRLLRYVLRFLSRYCQYQQQKQTDCPSDDSVLGHVGAVFAPLLLLKGVDQYNESQLALANDVTARLIHEHTAVFHQWLFDHPTEDGGRPSARTKHNHMGSSRKPVIAAENSTSSRRRKRKERNESISSNQVLERKVIRSNSEERRVEETVCSSKSDSIRRVSSHEDFRHSKNQTKVSSSCNRYTTVVEISSQPPNVHIGGLPLQECNHTTTAMSSKDEPSSQAETSKQPKQQEKEKENDKHTERERPSTEWLEDENERRRSSERISHPARRKTAWRKHAAHRGASYNYKAENHRKSCKENEALDAVNTQRELYFSAKMDLQSGSSGEKDDGDDTEIDPEREIESFSDESRPESQHSFLQLHPPERDRSPSPSVSPCTPPLDLSTLHQSVDSTEPLTSRASWSFARHQHEDEGSRGMLLSPRNSMILTRRIYTDHNVPPSPPGDHQGPCVPPNSALDLDNTMKKLNKQIASIKRKLKRYEEGFEREFGYRPSQADKMANKDIKKMCAELNRLRKEVNRIKDDPLSAVIGQPSEANPLRLGLKYFRRVDCNAPPAPPSTDKTVNVEETVADVERRLKEKRRVASRPDSLEDMTPDQQAAEKLAMQKALLLLEKLCGRATTKQDREIVRPLYDRYRQLKRIVARATSSKLKDSINELATIHEHETMDFNSSTSLVAAADSNISSVDGQTAASSSNLNASSTAPASTTQSMEEASDSQTSSSDSIGENLHSLPLSELLLQLSQTREEKKRLRREVRELEEQYEIRTGRRMQREERSTLFSGSGPSGNTYSAYKKVKAKLRLLEALVAKLR